MMEDDGMTPLKQDKPIIGITISMRNGGRTMSVERTSAGHRGINTCFGGIVTSCGHKERRFRARGRQTSYTLRARCGLRKPPLSPVLLSGGPGPHVLPATVQLYSQEQVNVSCRMSAITRRHADMSASRRHVAACLHFTYCA